MVVGHSAACTLAWLAADARPDRVAKVVLIGGFPPADGEPYADFFEIEDGVMPFPGWAPFEGPDAADLDEPARQTFAAAAIPVPEGVARGVVQLSDERRYDVPVVLVCPEFTPGPGPGVDRRRRLPELAGQAPRPRRHRLRALADAHPAGRAGPHPGRSSRSARPGACRRWGVPGSGCPVRGCGQVADPGEQPAEVNGFSMKAISASSMWSWPSSPSL